MSLFSLKLFSFEKKNEKNYSFQDFFTILGLFAMQRNAITLICPWFNRKLDEFKTDFDWLLRQGTFFSFKLHFQRCSNAKQKCYCQNAIEKIHQNETVMRPDHERAQASPGRCHTVTEVQSNHGCNTVSTATRFIIPKTISNGATKYNYPFFRCNGWIFEKINVCDHSNNKMIFLKKSNRMHDYQPEQSKLGLSACVFRLKKNQTNSIWVFVA